jgi:hypothetical protein
MITVNNYGQFKRLNLAKLKTKLVKVLRSGFTTPQIIDLQKTCSVYDIITKIVL